MSALVRVTLRDGALHEDVGYGALENARGKGAALDKVSTLLHIPRAHLTELLQCKKEAVTDAIKRTLRNFGNVLGNCLYDKQYVSEIAKVKAPIVSLHAFMHNMILNYLSAQARPGYSSPSARPRWSCAKHACKGIFPTTTF